MYAVTGCHIRCAHSHTLLSCAPQVLKLLYDEEVLEEDAVLAWADEKTMAEEDERKYLQKAAAFVAWLREAESEEESGSDTSE